ncbi:MAG: hypothetical protein WEB58_01980 [Planctomycetaceae bacterium]
MNGISRFSLAVSTRFKFASLLMAALVGISFVEAHSEDKFEGALWKFELKPVKGRGETRVGRFRVNGKSLYQKESADDSDLEKKVGRKEVLKKGKTRLVFEDLRANRGKYTGINGRVVINFDSAGEWSGRMVDAEGAHWNFKCSRVQE